jgi:hypothetical protein
MSVRSHQRMLFAMQGRVGAPRWNQRMGMPGGVTYYVP